MRKSGIRFSARSRVPAKTLEHATPPLCFHLSRSALVRKLSEDAAQRVEKQSAILFGEDEGWSDLQRARILPRRADQYATAPHLVRHRRRGLCRVLETAGIDIHAIIQAGPSDLAEQFALSGQRSQTFAQR